MERSCSRPSQKVAERGGGTPTGTSGPMASTPNMPRVAARTDPGPRCGRATLIGSHRRENNDFGRLGQATRLPPLCAGGPLQTDPPRTPPSGQHLCPCFPPLPSAHHKKYYLASRRLLVYLSTTTNQH